MQPSVRSERRVADIAKVTQRYDKNFHEEKDSRKTEVTQVDIFNQTSISMGAIKDWVTDGIWDVWLFVDGNLSYVL